MKRALTVGEVRSLIQLACSCTPNSQAKGSVPSSCNAGSPVARQVAWVVAAIYDHKALVICKAFLGV